MIVSQILNLQWKRRKIRLQNTAKERGVDFTLVICISKELQFLGKKSDLERVRMNKKNT